MMPYDDFGSYLRDALAHLYDRPYLRTHPIVPLLLGTEPLDVADALRRLLLDAIDQLRPPEPCPPASPTWRRYRYLVLRYVEGATPQRIAYELQISVRQSQREHNRALSEITALLWQRHLDVTGRQATTTPHLAAPGSRGFEKPSGRDVDVAGSVASNAADLLKIGSLPPDEATSLPEALSGAMRIVARLAKLRGAQIDVAAAGPVPPVHVNRLVLRQVLVDLLESALESSSHARIQVSMVDTAEGVIVEMATPVGRPQASRRLTEVEARLSASRTLIGLQGGSLTAQPRNGYALYAVVMLPRSPTRTLLVVDDNPDVAYMFARFLEDHGYRVLHASTGRAALQLSRKSRPDVITIDVLMPSQDGWDLLEKLTSDPVTRGIPVIMCSVLPERSLALSMGVREFLGKPVTREALVAALERCVPARG